MKKKLSLVLILTLIAFFNVFYGVIPSWAALSGNIEKDALSGVHRVIDAQTGAPIGNARITIPSNGYGTNSNGKGEFEIDTNIDKKVILSVEKEGYRPFTITIDSSSVKSPMRLGIVQSKTGDISIESSLCHLGDDLFSENSANAGEFKTKATGPFLTKSFQLAPLKPGEEAILIIGSVIGLDTKMAREMGQNRIATVYASPAEIFFNGQKIGELHINGDNQEVAIPRSLIKQRNELTVKTGRNLFQTAYVDYDDIEIMNVRVETRAK